MTPDEARLKLLEDVIRKQIPSFEVRFKDKGPGSGGQKLIAKLIWLFNREYMTRYISTFYPRVYWPTEADYRDDPRGAFKTLAHEAVHLMDDHRRRGWFAFSYLLPAVLAPLALGALAAIWASNWFLMFLVALVFLLPLPAYWRMWWELRGYSMSMAMYAWRDGSIPADTKTWMAERFTGPAYYFMWPFKRGIMRRLAASEKAIHNGDILKWGPIYAQVHRIQKLSDSEAVALASREGGS